MLQCAIFGAERLLKEAGLDPKSYDGTFAREVIRRLGIAVRNSLGKSQPVTYIGHGQAKVYEVASNRRLLGPDGKVGNPLFSYRGCCTSCRTRGTD